MEELCLVNHFHLSKNLFKRDEEFDYQMITFRTDHMDIYKFITHILEMETKLKNLSILYDKVEVEECIYDSNAAVDKDWI